MERFGVDQRMGTSTLGPKRSSWTRFKLQFARRFGWAWKPLLYGGVLAGSLMGRAVEVSQMAPLGIAFYAAVRAAGFRPPAALPVGVAVLLGSASVLPLGQVLWVALSLLACSVVSSSFRVGEKGPTPLRAALAATVSVTIPGVLASSSTLSLVFWAVLSGVLALVFCLGVDDITSGRAFRGGRTDSTVPAVIILAGVLVGLDGLSFSWVSVRDLVAGLVVLMCSRLGGAPMGAASGAVLGLSFLFSAAGGQLDSGGLSEAILPEAQSMAFVVGGLLGGTFRDLGKFGVAAAFALGLVTYSMATMADALDLLVFSYSALAAAGLFLVLPQRWTAVTLASMTISRQTDVGAELAAAAGGSIQLLERVKGISRVLKEISGAFEQAAPVQVSGKSEAEAVFEQVVARVCHSCSMYEHCWETDFHKTYQLYSDLWRTVEDVGPIPIKSVPEELDQQCIRPADVANTFNYVYDLHRSRYQWKQKIEEGRSVAGEYVKNVARLLDRFLEEGTTPQGRSGRSPAFQIRSGVARLPKRGGHISGDSYAAVPLEEARYLMALSDGMGVGHKAATESKQCIRLLQEVLGAGFAIEVAVNTVNSALLLRSPDESFATVDLALLDTAVGRAEFVKIGAAPSFVKRGSDVTVVKMPSVPVGIINQIQVEPEYRQIHPGDIIVMITDGIWDVSKDDTDKERWLLKHLEEEKSTDPEEIAESVLARALELMPEPSDDMTVLVCRCDAVSGTDVSSESRRPVVSEWAPARRAPRILYTKSNQ